MPISTNTLTVFADDTDRTSYATLSITPTSGKPVVVGVQSTIASGTGPNEPTLSGNNLTWTKVDGIAETGSSTSRLTVFISSGSSPSAGVLTASFGGQTQTTCSIIPVELTSSAFTNIVKQTVTAQVTGTNSGITSTLPNPFTIPQNATMGFFSINRGIAMTVGSGFSDAGNTGGVSSSLQAEFRSDNSTTVNASWANGATNGMIVGMEISAIQDGMLPDMI